MHKVNDDCQLWSDFKQGKSHALSEIYHQHVNALFRYGRKFSNDEGLVKDTIQDLFCDLIRTRNKLGDTDNIYFYLLKALKRKIIREVTKSRKIKHSDFDHAPHEIIMTYSIEEEWIEKERLSENEQYLRNALSKLSNKQKEILYYRFNCELEYAEICEIMGIKYGSARKMVFRAIKSHREILVEVNLSLLSVFISVV